MYLYPLLASALVLNSPESVNWAKPWLVKSKPATKIKKYLTIFFIDIGFDIFKLLATA
jgi:hypothetical protein